MDPGSRARPGDADKGAVPELRALIDARVGLGLTAAAAPAARRELVRYVLVNEFRMDLQGPSPESLELIQEPANKEQRERVRAIAGELRRSDPAVRSARG